MHLFFTGIWAYSVFCAEKEKSFAVTRLDSSRQKGKKKGKEVPDYRGCLSLSQTQRAGGMTVATFATAPVALSFRCPFGSQRCVRIVSSYCAWSTSELKWGAKRKGVLSAVACIHHCYFEKNGKKRALVVGNAGWTGDIWEKAGDSTGSARMLSYAWFMSCSSTHSLAKNYSSVVLQVVPFYLLHNESHYSAKSAGKLGILCFLWILVQNKYPLLSWHCSSLLFYLCDYSANAFAINQPSSLWADVIWLFCQFI